MKRGIEHHWAQNESVEEKVFWGEVSYIYSTWLYDPILKSRRINMAE